MVSYFVHVYDLGTKGARRGQGWLGGMNAYNAQAYFVRRWLEHKERTLGLFDLT